jgi:hypothetical protein
MQVKLEADYDRKQKESLKQEGVSVRWEMGLNKRSVATFRFKEAAAEDLRLNAGEELLLKLDAPTASLYGQEWQAQGVILRLFDGEVRVFCVRVCAVNEKERVKGNCPISGRFFVT